MKSRTTPNVSIPGNLFYYESLVGDYLTAGGNFFDTAHCYAFWVPDGTGASERELGRCLRELGIPDGVVVATKGGHPAGPGYPRPTEFLASAVLHSDIDDSLNRLQKDTIDLYYLHRDDGTTPVGEIIETLNQEIRRKRLRYLGASNWSVERIAEANVYAQEKGLQGFVASQIQWSLAEPNWKQEEPGADPVHRTVGKKEYAFHQGSGLPLIAFSATAGGYFAGNPKANPLYDNRVNQARRERARTVAAQHGITPQQIALSWLRCQPFPVIPIFATNVRDHLAELLGAAPVELTPEEARFLDDGTTPT